jgi:hypothetical protein
VDKSEKIQGIDELDHSEASDIFTEFALNLLVFQDFVTEHFDRAYPSPFVYQIQPIAPRFRYYLVHNTASINGKENANTIAIETAIAAKLSSTFFPITWICV